MFECAKCGASRSVRKGSPAARTSTRPGPNPSDDAAPCHNSISKPTTRGLAIWMASSSLSHAMTPAVTMMLAM
jgi:hypothetical protein